MNPKTAATDKPEAPSPKCELCNDTGWVIVEKYELSAARRCPRNCAVVSDYGLGGAAPHKPTLDPEEEAQIPFLYRQAGFDNFNHSGLPVLVEAMTKTKAFATTLDVHPGRPRGLMLIGPCGTGKTHLAVAALRHLIRVRAYRGLYLDYSGFIHEMLASFDRESESSTSALIKEAKQTQVLLIDDLGTYRAKEWVQNTFYGILQERAITGLPVIVTTNLSETRNALANAGTLDSNMGVQIRSRLMEMCEIVKTDGAPDYRDQKRAQWEQRKR